MNTETFERLLKQAVPDGKTIREIRIRTEKPVMILLESGENLLFSDGTCGKTESYGKKKMGSLEIREDRSVVLADQELIRGILETCSRHSLYAYEREISQGFLTIRGGHRVGIAGKAVVEDGHVRTVRDLSSLNIRVAHEVKGCAKNVLPYLMDGETFLDTLLISPPGAGKTTLLRDLIRELSCGGTWGAGKNVSVVDERSEIAACFGGVAQCDLGPRTDVMDGCPKSQGMLMMLRSMSPQVLAVGISERTEGDSIDQLAQTVLSQSRTFRKVLAFNIPKSRSFMHLDTVFTMVDRDKFTVHPNILNDITVFVMELEEDGRMQIRQENGRLEDILKEHLGLAQVTLIPCGQGHTIDAAREQWSDGSNTLAIAPGEVVVYTRNYVTNRSLEEAGIRIHAIPSAELSRGRGGPRCMSMPLVREKI